MAQSTAPFSMNNVSVKLKAADDVGTAVEYRCQLNRAELVPAASTSGGGNEMQTFCDTFSTTGITNASWTLELAGFQAWADVTDLTNFLFDHEGEELVYELTPLGGTVSPTNPKFTGTVIAAPTPIGGTANNYGQFTVSLAAQGKPTKVTA